MQEEKEIKDVTMFLMIGTALFFDVVQIVIGWIPVFGNVLSMCVSLFAFMSFFLWFYMYGIRMITPKRLFTMIGAGIIEMIPYVDLLPAWTLTVIFLIGTTKVKKLAEKHPGLASGALKVAEKVKAL